MSESEKEQLKREIKELENKIAPAQKDVEILTVDYNEAIIKELVLKKQRLKELENE